MVVFVMKEGRVKKEREYLFVEFPETFRIGKLIHAPKRIRKKVPSKAIWVVIIIVIFILFFAATL